MKVLSFGAVLWDIIEGQEFIGGAPFNLAAHMAQCGAQASMMTRVGSDRLGDLARLEMARLGVNTQLLQIDPEHPTGWAKVELSGNGVPTFQFPDDPAYNFIEADEVSLKQLNITGFDVICFGTLEQKGDVTRQSLHRVLRSIKPRHVFYDVNVRLNFYPQPILKAALSYSTIVKLNDDEVQMICPALAGKKLSEKEFVGWLCANYPVEVVCVTKGPKGCTVYFDGQSEDSSAPQVTVADTVGSGDAFSAGFLYELCRGKSPFEAAKMGNALGAFVASCHGAIPQYREGIRELLNS
jgi:fructokinase